MAPLAAVPPSVALREGIATVLSSLTPEDCQHVYQAIRLAQPGGMGEVTDMDIQETPPTSLRDAMQAAAERDMVAMQYINDFETVLGEIAPRLQQNVSQGWSIEHAIIECQLQLLRRYPDSLISRKCGQQVANQAAALADDVLQSGEPGTEHFEEAMADLDFWMRADHHRRNPGTTADLIAAGLFAALRERQLNLPFQQS